MTLKKYETRRISTRALGAARQASVEFDLLCQVTRVKPDYDQLENTLRNDIDWTILSSLAAAHSVTVRLVQVLGKSDWVCVPAEAKQSLLAFVQLHKVHSLKLASELMRVSYELSQRGIRFATFKGPSLAVWLYGDLSLREFNDIDLIIDQDQVVNAERVLSSLGYRPIHGCAGFRKAFLSYQRQYMFVKDGNESLALDLHWDFVGMYRPFTISSKEIWSNLDQLRMGGLTVPTLGRADLGLLLAGHGAKEGWRCLGWVADFAMYIEKNPDLDWRTLLDRARRRGSSRSLLVGWQLATQLLGARLDAQLLKLAEHNLPARAAAEALMLRIRNGYPAPASVSAFGEPELHENWRQRARSLVSFIVTRTVSDYVSMPLPRSLWRIYHLTRPFRLAWTLVRTVPTNPTRQAWREM